MAKLLTASGRFSRQTDDDLGRRGMSADKANENGFGCGYRTPLAAGGRHRVSAPAARSPLRRALSKSDAPERHHAAAVRRTYRLVSTRAPDAFGPCRTHQLRPQYAERNAQEDDGAEADFKEEQRGRPAIDPGSDHGQGRGRPFWTSCPAAAELQKLMLAPLRKEDRAHFLKCLLAIAKAPPSDSPPSGRLNPSASANPDRLPDPRTAFRTRPPRQGRAMASGDRPSARDSTSSRCAPIRGHFGLHRRVARPTSSRAH